MLIFLGCNALYYLLSYLQFLWTFPHVQICLPGNNEIYRPQRKGNICSALTDGVNQFLGHSS